MTELIPYSFGSEVLPTETERILEPGMLQGVHFTVPVAQREWFIKKIESWFEGRDEVILVDSGISSKAGLGYIILEWEECEINPLFLAILRDEDLVEDYSVYIRSEEV